MSFTPEHIEILEKHREHWLTLTTAGYMRNLDEPVKRELQRVFNEAVGPQRFTLWCNDCVVDLVRLLYTNYDQRVLIDKGLTATAKRHLDHIAAVEQRVDDLIHEYLTKPEAGATTFDGLVSAIVAHAQPETPPAPSAAANKLPARKRRRR
ncbi:hypothetical protein FHW36_10664 [Chitinophaga polysaccharea]|uniref:Uncharacterized protein n=1 Tax=Chitinophaga polysaccharea TaxID=1293035 RepID=A0A561PL54_9BACT|nr:hypothetical protein [Chitinophaga polysaccharea]TWF38841.1 hypothetical protein FHW36_10664 [Chitinophaga polysaccharea]